ncbi:MAG: SDR family NAD(P)-dependent oxidoreductase [Pseudomonadota bacterium]|nr:SDR family NAD(P)-dependent oxidoreductase [Pseudomonadota bacterium]
MTLQSLSDGYRAVVFGASGGLGSAFVSALCQDDRCAEVHAGSRSDVHSSANKLRAFRFDLEDEGSIAAAVAESSRAGPLHLVVVATGMLHAPSITPEKSWRFLTPASLQRAFSINAIGPALIAKHSLGHLATNEKAVFVALSARVGSITDNRRGGWHAYRASKSALNMLIRTLAIELAARNKAAICVGLHPGTVGTELSKPFLGGSDPLQVFAPSQSADHLLRVIDHLSPTQSGRLFAWDGSEIPF